MHIEMCLSIPRITLGKAWPPRLVEGALGICCLPFSSACYRVHKLPTPTTNYIKIDMPLTPVELHKLELRATFTADRLGDSGQVTSPLSLILGSGR